MLLERFGCDNLREVVIGFLTKYPNNKFIISADNDRHLNRNQGLLKALEVQKLNEDRISVALPDFGEIKPSKEASDWNDLVRLIGFEKAAMQLSNKLRIKSL